MESLNVFSAGVAMVLTKKAAAAFSEQSGATVQIGSGGSAYGISRLKAGERFDVMILADSSVIDTQLMPEYADGYYIWGGNEMVIEGHGISSENWTEKILSPDAKILHHNPYRDPSGYRAVMAMKLADSVSPDLSEKLFSHPGYKGLDKALYESPATDDLADNEYRFVYKSGAVSGGKGFACLPPQMNMGAPEYEELYKTATFTLENGETVCGSTIYHAILIPKNAPNPAGAREFARLFLQSRFLDNGFTDVHKTVGSFPEELLSE